MTTAINEQLLARIAEHERLDTIVKGVYWEQANGKWKGCAVGCSLKDPDDHTPLSGTHELYPERLGLPEWLARLEDAIFEGLPDDESLTWPRRFAEAIPVGADLSGLEDSLAVRRMRERLLPLATSWPESIRDQTISAIEGVIAALLAEPIPYSGHQQLWNLPHEVAKQLLDVLERTQGCEGCRVNAQEVKDAIRRRHPGGSEGRGMSRAEENRLGKLGRCPRCLRERRGEPGSEFGFSFAPPCPECGYDFIPEEREPKLYVHVCPYCMRQHRGPGGHHMAGDDRATRCIHAHPGEQGVDQPRLVRIEVQPVEPFEPLEIPHDRVLAISEEPG